MRSSNEKGLIFRPKSGKFFDWIVFSFFVEVQTTGVCKIYELKKNLRKRILRIIEIYKILKF